MDWPTTTDVTMKCAFDGHYPMRPREKIYEFHDVTQLIGSRS